MISEDILKQGFEEFMNGGFDEENKNRYKLAVTAYFKAIIQVCDLIISRKKGFTPSNHTERFRMLEKDFPIVYKSVDSIFKICQKPKVFEHAQKSVISDISGYIFNAYKQRIM